MSRALFLIVVLCPLACSQSLIEEAVTGLLGRTSRMGRNFVDMARGQPTYSTGVQGFLDTPQKSTVILRPQDGTVLGGFVRGFMKDVDDSGNRQATLLHPDEHQLVGALIGGLANGRVTTTTTTPKPEEEVVLGIIESMARRRKARPPASSPDTAKPVLTAAPVAALPVPRIPPPAPAPAPAPAPVARTPVALAPAPALAALPSPVGDELNPAPGVLDDFRRDVQRDAPECSQKAKAQLSKVLGNFRKGVLDCVGVEDADLGDVLNRLRQVLLSADRLPTSLAHNLARCSALRNTTSSNTTSSVVSRIPPRGSAAEQSAARCILQALADARDRLYKIPTETAAFSRRVAFLLAGTKSDTRVRACVASQLTSMAHPIVATARQLAGCVMVGPDFTDEQI